MRERMKRRSSHDEEQRRQNDKGANFYLPTEEKTAHSKPDGRMSSPTGYLPNTERARRRARNAIQAGARYGANDGVGVRSQVAFTEPTGSPAAIATLVKSRPCCLPQVEERLFYVSPQSHHRGVKATAESSIHPRRLSGNVAGSLHLERQEYEP